MNRMFCTAIALAMAGASVAHGADMAVRPYVPAVAPPAYDWTGFYIGGHGGYAWARKEWSTASGVLVGSHKPEDLFGGIQGGFNWQTGPWVLGIEAEASWGEIRDGRPFIEQDSITDGSSNTVFRDGRVRRGGTTIDNFGSVAVRAGYAWNQWLGYVKGGGAWVSDTYRVFNIGVSPEVLDATASATRWGWLVGVGVEYGITPNWSAKLEYDYMDFGAERTTFTHFLGGASSTFALDVKQTVSLVKFGINYRFALR